MTNLLQEEFINFILSFLIQVLKARLDEVAGIVMHAFSPSALEADAEGTLSSRSTWSYIYIMHAYLNKQK